MPAENAGKANSRPVARLLTGAPGAGGGAVRGAVAEGAVAGSAVSREAGASVADGDTLTSRGRMSAAPSIANATAHASIVRANARTTGWQTVLSAQPPSLGAWTQLTAVWNAGWGRMQLYVDGRLEGTLAATAWTSSGTFHIGQSIDGGRFAGAIDEVTVYAKVQ